MTSTPAHLDIHDHIEQLVSHHTHRAECDCDYWDSKHRWHCATNYPTADSGKEGDR